MFTAFGLLFVAIGGALMVRGYSARAQAARSLSWPSAEGVVLSSGVEADEFQEGDSLGTVRKFRPAVKYSFRAPEGERQGTEIAIGINNLYGDQHVAERRAARYPIGAKVRVYYDPAAEPPSWSQGIKEAQIQSWALASGLRSRASLSCFWDGG